MKCVGTPMSLSGGNVFGDPVVEDALAFDHVLLRIEGGRIVLEVLDQGAGLGSFVEDLRLAFIDAATAIIHGKPPLLLADRETG